MTRSVAAIRLDALRLAIASDPGPCQHWPGAITEQGYGRAFIDGRLQYAHRWAYQQIIGPIPDGLTLDHECHNSAALAGLCSGGSLCPHRRCWNPYHVQVETLPDNTRRSPLTVAGANLRKTHCKHGHLFDVENTRITVQGGRLCRTCHRLDEERRRKAGIATIPIRRTPRRRR